MTPSGPGSPANVSPGCHVTPSRDTANRCESTGTTNQSRTRTTFPSTVDTSNPLRPSRCQVRPSVDTTTNAGSVAPPVETTATSRSPVAATLVATAPAGSGPPSPRAHCAPSAEYQNIGGEGLPATGPPTATHPPGPWAMARTATPLRSLGRGSAVGPCQSHPVDDDQIDGTASAPVPTVPPTRPRGPAPAAVVTVPTASDPTGIPMLRQFRSSDDAHAAGFCGAPGRSDREPSASHNPVRSTLTRSTASTWAAGSS